MTKAKPRLLSCLHSVCTACHATLVAGQVSLSPYVRICCPICGLQTSVSTTPPPQQDSDALVSRLIAVGRFVGAQTASRSPLQCHPCALAGDLEDAMRYCIECERALCPRCAKEHAESVIGQTHCILPFEDIEPQMLGPRVLPCSSCKPGAAAPSTQWCSHCAALVCNDCVASIHVHPSVGPRRVPMDSDLPDRVILPVLDAELHMREVFLRLVGQCESQRVSIVAAIESVEEILMRDLETKDGLATQLHGHVSTPPDTEASIPPTSPTASAPPPPLTTVPLSSSFDILTDAHERRATALRRQRTDMEQRLRGLDQAMSYTRHLVRLVTGPELLVVGPFVLLKVRTIVKWAVPLPSCGTDPLSLLETPPLGNTVAKSDCAGLVITHLSLGLALLEPSIRKWRQGQPGVSEGHVCVFGGQNSDVDLAAVHAYDPFLDTWHSLPDLTVPRRGLSVATVENRIYALGGYTLKEGTYATCERLVLNSGQAKVRVIGWL